MTLLSNTFFILLLCLFARTAKDKIDNSAQNKKLINGNSIEQTRTPHGDLDVAAMKQKAELNPLRLGAEGDFGKFKLPDFLTKKKPATIDPFQIEHDRKEKYDVSREDSQPLNQPNKKHDFEKKVVVDDKGSDDSLSRNTPKKAENEPSNDSPVFKPTYPSVFNNRVPGIKDQSAHQPNNPHLSPFTYPGILSWNPIANPFLVNRIPKQPNPKTDSAGEKNNESVESNKDNTDHTPNQPNDSPLTKPSDNQQPVVHETSETTETKITPEHDANPLNIDEQGPSSHTHVMNEIKQKPSEDFDGFDDQDVPPTDNDLLDSIKGSGKESKQVPEVLDSPKQPSPSSSTKRERKRSNSVKVEKTEPQEVVLPKPFMDDSDVISYVHKTMQASDDDFDSDEGIPDFEFKDSANSKKEHTKWVIDRTQVKQLKNIEEKTPLKKVRHVYLIEVVRNEECPDDEIFESDFIQEAIMREMTANA